ncbi:MAG: anthranilate phosphoribosyltransferase, partial [Staphylococcus epidermidis]|nr:anthranilate phosphoribosyltransferase [Staphylococcus epidermidis]
MPLLEKIKQNKSLSKKDMQSFIITLFDSNIETNVKVELLKAYTNKDMGQYELTYLVEYFIQTNYPNQPFYNKAMCVCGTGGDQSNSFNISTTVAFVVASAGVPVIKHGNKSITSHSGSTDVLHEMNIKTNKMNEVEQQLNLKGLAFISATDSYPMMKKLQSIRKSIATPTIFNLIGPLINPFKLTYQVMGVYEASQL